MRTKIITVTIIAIHFLNCLSLFSQEQEQMIKYLRVKFQSYLETVPWEEILVHSDREEYIAGEDLWFNLYLIDRQSLKPSSESKIAYFELLNFENRPIIQKRIFLNKGFGPGQLQLPDTLSSGIYTIRAYTNWMKNFLPGNCFSKDIKVFNALNNGKFKQKLITGKSENEGKTESGNFLKKGSGISLVTKYLGSAGLEIVITANEKFISENSNLIYLFVQTHGIIDHISAQMIKGNITRTVIPVESLTEGVTQITVFDSKGKPLCEKYTYIQGGKRINISLSCADSSGTREKISVNLESINGILKSLDSGNLSISVTPVVNEMYSSDMNDYLVFGTEFGQNILNRSLKERINDTTFEFIDSLLENAASKWIIWQEILSDSLPDFKYEAEKEDHFLYGRLIEDEHSYPVPSEPVIMCIPGKKAEFQYDDTNNEGNFKFHIHIDGDIKDLIIMPHDINKNQRIILESSFPDQFPKSEISVDSSRKSIPQYIEDWSVNYQVNKIYGVTASGSPVKQAYLPVKPVRFYGKPDIELILSDYVSLPEMEEVFFELLPHVSLKKKSSNYEILITDRVDDKRSELTPDLFLDGVKIKDPAIIADLDPSTVDKIEVIKEKYVTGNYFFPGIVNVITKAADFSSIQLPDYMIRLPYRPVDPVLSYVLPDYSTPLMKDNTIPDFRNTIYWNPSLKPDKEGKITAEFWTSDVVARYEINVQGIGPGGEIISTRKLFTVK
jgi:hypothetical protein